MLLKLSDLSLELNLSLEWSTNLREWERRKGELSLLFRRANESQKMCSIWVASSKMKETSTYSVAPEVLVPRTGTSSPTRSNRWASVQADLTVVRDSNPSEVPPELPVRDRKWILTREAICKDSYADFLSWTETSGYGPKLLVKDRNIGQTPEVFSQTRAHLSQPNRNFLSGWPELPFRHRKFNRNFRSCILNTISKLVRMLTSNSELQIRWSCTFQKDYSEGYTNHMDTQSKT